ncbi:chitin deacetylase 8-like [Zophobas morio]|uniref:chitin deacetylase 8-like n=1 Tax=Zophobas morio TaxID=2755281 RepID=UPI003082ED69
MRFLLVSALCFLLARTASVQAADCGCSGTDCRCCGTTSPVADGEIPQLIVLSFNEAILNDTFSNIWQPLLFDRKNPDGNPVSGTFFVPHEYTDYKKVQDLYVQGFEIGSNSITGNSSSQYWSEATEETLVKEFQGQRTIISTFANIPIDDIIGARTPQLQLQGDVSINAYITSGLQYDSSWTSRSTKAVFPYTLDYVDSHCQECRLGTTCPSDTHAGFWIAPIIDLQGNNSDECAALSGCNIRGTADEISAWLLEQVDRGRSSNKAPLTLLVPTGWFRATENSYEGFQKFLDTLGSYNDVFLVSQKQVLDWMNNPVTLDQFQTEVLERTSNCTEVNCRLENSEGQIRYMYSCVPCPDKYPWLDDPLGE